MKLQFVVLGVCLMIMALSCRKETTVTVENTGTPLLTQVKVVDQLYSEYIYNAANLISAEESKYIFTLHHYDDMNKLLSTDYFGDNSLLSNDSSIVRNALNRKEWVTDINSSKGATLSFEYNNDGQLINTIFSWPLNSDQENSSFSYDANNRIGRQTLYWGLKQIGYIDYLYDGAGNLINESLYSLNSTSDPELRTATEYEFDNHQNPFFAFKKLMTPGINTNINNIIKETYTIHYTDGKGSDKIQTTSTSYTYNSKGYPVKKNSSVEYIY